MSFSKNLRENFKQFGSAPVIRAFNLKRNFHRAGPVFYLLFFGVIALLIGLFVSFLQFLVYVGSFVVIMYIIYVIISYKAG
jgi:Ca2+/Na+ antiporter